MGSDDDMFRIWSGPEGSSHKEPLTGIRIHPTHWAFLLLGAARAPKHPTLPLKPSLAYQKYASLLFRGNLGHLGAARLLMLNLEHFKSSWRKRREKIRPEFGRGAELRTIMIRIVTRMMETGLHVRAAQTLW